MHIRGRGSLGGSITISMHASWSHSGQGPTEDKLLLSVNSNSLTSRTLEALDAPRGGLGGRVIVPSRCYFNPSPQTPLDGVRISVKDNIHVAGHKTTLCNRAWMDLYPPEDKHAACVQTLIHAGAIIVGKVKLQAMIMGEEPLECVGFTAPFNPRADGYQVPSGSSHGSAAGISSYDWLDFSLGSDSMYPKAITRSLLTRLQRTVADASLHLTMVAFLSAQLQGSWTLKVLFLSFRELSPRSQTLWLRCSWIDREFDMPVFFGRDISRFQHFIYAWYGDSPLLRKPLRVSVRSLF